MFSNFQFISTPKTIKHFLCLIGIISIFSAVVKFFIPLLGLSLMGVLNGHVWQPISYLFLQPEVFEISFNSILHLSLYLFAIYVAGSEIIHQKGNKSFYILFFGPGILAALYLILGMHFMQTSYVIFGLGIPTYSLLCAFMMLSSNTKFLLFHALPVKLPTIILVIFSIHMLITISNSSFFIASAYFLAVLISYLYCLKVWKIKSPFYRLHKFEEFFIGKKKKTEYYDFSTKSQMTEEQWVDELLDKTKGKGLSWKDKWRLKKFFKRKKTH